MVATFGHTVPFRDTVHPPAEKLQADSAAIIREVHSHLIGMSAADRRQLFQGSSRDASNKAINSLPGLEIRSGGGPLDQGLGADAAAKPQPERSAFIAQAHKTKGWNSAQPPSPEGLKEKMGDAKIFLWGDDHADKSSAGRLENAADRLVKSGGVTTLSLEGLKRSQDLLLNNWLQAKKGSSQEAGFEKQIEKYVGQAGDPLWTEKNLRIMKAFKDAGVKRIIGIENDRLQLNPNGSGGPDREASWNAAVQNEIKSDQHSKVLVFGGVTHFLPTDGHYGSLVAKAPVKYVDLTPPYQYLKGAREH
jgi:hypothetical protein